MRPTPSSIAAMSAGDGEFVVDPTLSVSGGGGSSAYVGKRNPLVFDVYVVIEEGVNDQMYLPDYSRAGGRRGKSVASPHSHSPRRPTTCCVQ